MNTLNAILGSRFFGFLFLLNERVNPEYTAFEGLLKLRN